MLAIDQDPAPISLPQDGPEAGDYDRVRLILAYITERWREQPSLDAIARHVGLTTTQVHHLFRRWCGLTPKAFLAAVTLENARTLLAGSASVLDASLELGLSGPGRLHDLFVSYERMTPGEWRTGGEGVAMRYGFHPSPFGEAILVATERGLVGIGFVDGGDRAFALADMRRRWPRATFTENDGATAPLARRVFDPERWSPETPLRVVLIGTDFEIRVWETLLRIPLGRATTYSSIATHIGRPTAARAVGAAVGKNPVSFVVPCHRVLGRAGSLTGYHWGLTRKQAMLGWESGRLGAA